LAQEHPARRQLDLSLTARPAKVVDAAHTLFDPLERLVLEYAEAMTETPPTVGDQLVRNLRQHLSEAQLVELTAIICLENVRSRFNSAVGLTRQGFKDKCELAPVRRYA
jgi:alkylhydroperoxidase family enzyme